MKSPRSQARIICSAAALAAAACGSKGGGDSAASTATATATAQAPAASGAPAATAAAASDVLTVSAAVEAANAKPDMVGGKKVKVTGVVAKVGTQKAGKNETHYIKLVGAAGENTPSLTCDTHDKKPTVEDGATVTVEGTGELTDMKASDGSIKKRLDLRDCAVR